MNDFYLHPSFYAEIVGAIAIFRYANTFLSVNLRQILLGLISLFFIIKLDGSNLFLSLVVGYAITFPLIAWFIFAVNGVWAKKSLIGVGIVLSAVIMLIFKYPYYSSLIFGKWELVTNLNSVGWVGLSYMTFRAIDLLLYSGAKRNKNFNILQGITYLLFFTPFVAGPINRFRPYNENQSQPLQDLKRTDIRDAAIRVSIGIIKIVVISRFFYVHSVLNIGVPTEELSYPELALRLYAYLFYIYFDFAGYCDIAIALGRFFGVPIPENFNFPLFSRNLQDFWNRWHISLSHWCRDHIFYSLMRIFGRRLPWVPQLATTAISIFITFFFVGAWHGDALHWILYGIYHGLGLSIWVLYSQGMKHYASDVHAKLESNRIYQSVSIFVTVSFVAWGLLITLGIETLQKLLLN